MKTIVVLGMHRCGTSMTAGILHHLGVHMGDYGFKPNGWNEKGYFENRYITEINEKILSKAGGLWNNPPSRERILTLGRMNEIGEIVNREKRELWGWKDPRTCLTIEIFLPFIENPYYVIIKRNRQSVVDSLYDRGGKLEDRQKLGNLYDVYVERCDEFIKTVDSKKALTLQYEDIINNSKIYIDKIADFIGVPRKDLSGFVEARLKHF